MDRRTALINLALATGSITLLARCNFGDDRIPLALDNLEISLEQEDLVRSLVNAILPEGKFPGATSLGVDGFVWIMADDCLPETAQKKFMNGLSNFTKLAGENDFTDMPVEKQAAWLDTVSRQPSSEEPVPVKENNVPFFLSTVKQLVVHGYMQSEYVMSNVMPYQLVPRSFSGCAPIPQDKRINVNG